MLLLKKWRRKTASMTGTSEESKKKQTTEGAGRKPKDRSTCRWKQKTARAKWPEKSSPNDSFQGKRRADSMPQRQQKMNKKRTHRIGFKFSSFCLKTPPLDFRHEKEKRLAKIPFYFFRGLVWGSRCEKWSKKRTEKQTKTRTTSKAWKIRPLMPYSVERGGGHPHYKYSVKHVSRPKM